MEDQPTVSPLQEPKNYYPYAPGGYVLKMATHVFGQRLFVIRRIASKVHEEAYEARYENSKGELMLDIFFPEEFIFVD